MHMMIKSIKYNLCNNGKQQYIIYNKNVKNIKICNRNQDICLKIFPMEALYSYIVYVLPLPLTGLSQSITKIKTNFTELYHGSDLLQNILCSFFAQPYL